MTKKIKILLIGIILLGIDYAFTGPITTTVINLSINTVLGSKEVVVKITDFDEPEIQFIDPDIPIDKSVYKLSIHINGKVNREVLVNRFYQLGGTIDTVLNMDFYQNTDSLIIKAPANTSGELIFTYRFYFSK